MGKIMVFQLPILYIRLEISLGYQCQNQVTVSNIGGNGPTKDAVLFFLSQFHSPFSFIHIAVGLVLLPDNYSSLCLIRFRLFVVYLVIKA